MKKILSIIITFAMMLTILAGVPQTALADGYSLSVSTNTSGVTAGKIVKINASVHNGSDTELVGYSITCGSNKCYTTDATLAAGEGSAFSFDFTVTSDMVGKVVKFSLVSDGKSLASSSINFSGGGSGTSKIGVTVTPNSKSTNLYKSGEVVTFTFKIENQGQVPLDNVYVKSGSKKVTSPVSIAVGKTQTVTYDYKYTKSATLKFTVVYSANGVSGTYPIDPISLGTEDRKVTATLKVDNNKPQPGEDVTFTLEIKNEGNIPYSNMTVNWNGQSWKTPSNSLKPDSDYIKTYKMSFDVSSDVQLTVSMRDQKGQTVSVHTNTISIHLPIDQDTLKSGVTFEVKVDRNEVTSDSTINFSGTVSNASIYDIKDVKVSDPSTGDIFTLDDMPANQSEKISKALEISKTATYNFVLSYTDRDGKTYTVNADPITVTVLSSDSDPAPSESAPEVTEATNVPLTPSKSGDPLLGWIIAAIVIFILIIIVGVALFVLWRQGSTGGSSVKASPKSSRQSKPRSSYSRGRSPVKSSYGKPKGRGFSDRNHF